MFTVIYTFQVKAGKNEQFEKAWLNLTELIYQFEGSLGSRLHKTEGDNNYIAYAQWPNKAKWQNSGDQLPVKAKELSAAMHNSCKEIKVSYELEMIDDLIKNTPFQPE